MKTIIILLFMSGIFFSSCKNTSENQGYDSGPTTKSERGSVSSGQASDTVNTDSQSE